MKKVNVDIEIGLYSFSELSAEDRQLAETAKEATRNSYAPYSNFHVGAAVRLANGDIIKGANQENSAFPSSLCAERTALFAAQANYPDQPVTAIAIAAYTNNTFTNNPVTPCGSCRQVMIEIEKRYKSDIRILLYGQNGVYVVNSAKDLLPLSFSL